MTSPTGQGWAISSHGIVKQRREHEGGYASAIVVFIRVFQIFSSSEHPNNLSTKLKKALTKCSPLRVYANQ